MKILLDYSDGRYTTRPISDEEALRLEHEGSDVAHVDDRVYDAYSRHCEQDGVWQALWRSISNEMYVRRRERELLPLEEADRQIARLKNDLARAERMAAFFQDEWLRSTGRQPMSEHDQVDNTEYACVFPQVGCDVAALPFEDWRSIATEILQRHAAQLTIKTTNHCCCGHAHVRLGVDQIERLRFAGFRVVGEGADELLEDA